MQGRIAQLPNFSLKQRTFCGSVTNARRRVSRSQLCQVSCPSKNWSKARKFAKACAIPIPSWLEEGFRHAKAADTERLFATALCTELCDDLLREGVDGLHFYTLNDPTLTADVCRALGRTPRHLALQASA